MSIHNRTWLTSGSLFVAVALIALLGVNSVYHTAAAKTATRTTTVQRGTVQATVSATGNVQSATSLNVSFATGGTVSEIDVQPGQQVAPGQTLGKLDDTQARTSLLSAEASLTAAQASLANAEAAGLTSADQAQNGAALAAAQQQ